MLDPIRVHNQNVSAIQITADQLILESVSRMRDRPRLPETENQSQAEIEDLRFKRRQAWELNVRRNLCTYNTYIRYARWEEDLGELDNARSVFERALEFTRFREPDVWRCYVEMELRNKQFRHALNILDKAVTTLPKDDQMWLKYASVLESLGDFTETRHVFQRWIAWEPPIHAFVAFVDFEVRMKDMTRARSIFERMLLVHPYPESYVRYAEFEIRMRQTARARAVFERGIDIMRQNIDEPFLMRFAQFEESENEVDRARALYKFALEHLKSEGIQSAYLRFERRFGGQDDIENAAIDTKKREYESVLEQNPTDYASWIEFCRLLQSSSSIENIREQYERAVSICPGAKLSKRDWAEYVLLYIDYAVFEEKRANDIERARKVYNDVLSKIPHKRFTFSRLWILYAYFEVRQHNLSKARQAFGFAIGTCPRSSIFDAYIEMEILLENEDRVRTLLQKFVDTIPSDIRAWVKFAQFESTHGHADAARTVFESAISSNAIDSMDMLWAFYIDFESKVGSVERVKSLYRRRLQDENNIALWKGLILLEAEVCGDIDSSRTLFDEAESAFMSDRDARKQLREFRVEFEKQFGTDDSVSTAESQLPRLNPDNTYTFPEEDESSASALLAAADLWEGSK